MKILITSVSAGAGHVRAAQAVEQYLNKEYQVEHVDLLTFSKNWFKKLYSDHYLTLINKQPKLWEKLYELSDKPNHPSVDKLRTFIESKSNSKFLTYLENYQPEVVISTHFMPPEILLRYKRKTGKTFKIVVVVTDFDVHYLWVNNQVDLYCVAGEMAKNKLISYGVDPKKIEITGIPIMPNFFHQYSEEEILSIKNNWNTNNKLTKVLMMAGGAGVGNLDEIAINILQKRQDVQLIALAGKNDELFNKLMLIKNQYPDNIIPLQFTSKVHELMQISDLVITKPGGLSSSECLAMNKPMIVVNPIPGQEEHNAKYLESLNIAKWSKNTIEDLNDVLNNIQEYNIAFEKIQRNNTEEKIKHILNMI